MRSLGWVFRPRRIFVCNFESSDTSNIAVIVVMPVNWQEKVRASTQKSATVKLTKNINLILDMALKDRYGLIE